MKSCNVCLPFSHPVASTFYSIVSFPCRVIANVLPSALGAQFTLNRVQDLILKDKQGTPEKEYPTFTEGNTFYWTLIPIFYVFIGNTNELI